MPVASKTNTAPRRGRFRNTLGHYGAVGLWDSNSLAQNRIAPRLSNILTNLSYMQSFRQIGLELWKIEAIQNRYPIVVNGVMIDRESRNPRPLSAL